MIAGMENLHTYTYKYKVFYLARILNDSYLYINFLRTDLLKKPEQPLHARIP